MKKRWQISLGVLFSLVAMLVLFQGLEIDKLASEISKANYWSLMPFILNL